MTRIVYAFALSLTACSASTEPPLPDDGVCGDGTVDPGEACDDGNTVSGDGCSATCQTEVPDARPHTTATWTLKDVATDSATACPDGFTVAAVSSQPVDAGGNPVGAPIVDMFDCAAGTGVTSPLEPGRYQTWVAITSTGGASTYAQSLPEILDLTAGDQVYDTDILNDGGYFSLTWSLEGDLSGTPLTCADIGAQFVALDATDAGGVAAPTQTFACGEPIAITAGLLAGDYDISVAALDADMQPLGTALGLAGTIQDANAITELGAITIPIAGQ